MIRKIPEDAFEQYLALGLERSYQALADKFGVTKRAIQNCADREGWTERLAKLEREARAKSDEKLGETMEETRSRHLKLLRAMSSRVATALRDHPLGTGMEAIRAAEVVIKLERLVIGEPSDRTELTVAQVTREEVDRLLARNDDEVVEPKGGGGGGGGDGEKEEEDVGDTDW